MTLDPFDPVPRLPRDLVLLTSLRLCVPAMTFCAHGVPASVPCPQCYRSPPAPPPRPARESPALYRGEWRQVRERVLERDGRRCRRCGSHDRLHVHHLVAVRIAPHLRLVESNLVTLCEACHSRETGSGR